MLQKNDNGIKTDTAESFKKVKSEENYFNNYSAEDNMKIRN